MVGFRDEFTDTADVLWQRDPRDSVRQQIVDALDTLFKRLLRTIGYETNLGANVFWWRATPLQLSELNAILAEDTVEQTVAAIGEHLHTLTINLELWLRPASRTDAGEEARQAVADLYRAIGIDTTLGAIAQDVSPPRGVETVRAEQEGVRCFVIRTAFQVEYVTLPFNPFE